MMIRTTMVSLILLGGCSVLTSFGDYAEVADGATPDSDLDDTGPSDGMVDGTSDALEQDAGTDANCSDVGAAEALPAPTPRFPWNGYRVGGMSPDLWWTGVDSSVGYEIQWVSEDGGALDCDWTAAFTDYHISDAPEIHWTPDGPLPDDDVMPAGARYCWRVRACRAGEHADPCSACSGEWSTSRYLTVGRTAGDFNGDGRAEVTGGAPRYHTAAGGTETGAVYIYDSTTGRTTRIESPATGETRFGFAVASADLDGDGFSDLVVGAPKQGNGRIHIYYGSAAALETEPQSFPSSSPRTDGTFGNTVVALGDLNGDGYEDVAVGEPADGSTGRMQIILGGEQGENATWWRVEPGSSMARFGAAIAGDADIDGDGLVDFAVGAPTAGSGMNRGRVNIYLGCSMNLCLPTQTLQMATGDLFGHGMAIGIIDGSSFHAELLVANAGSPSGAISRWRYNPGGRPFNSSFLTHPVAVPDTPHFGRSLCLTTTNGMPRLVTSDSGVAGRVFVNDLFDDTAGAWRELTFPRGAAERTGWSIGCHGDVYRDGETDIIVGSVGTFDGGATGPPGQVHVFNSRTPETAGTRLEPDTLNEADWFGWGVAP